MSKTFYTLMLISLFLLIIACSPEPKEANLTTEAVQISPDLSAIYQRSCKNCHEVEATGAPLTGDTNRWSDIMAKGMETVLDRALSGYQSMPPFGQCFECSPEQIEKLISYMGRPSK